MPSLGKNSYVGLAHDHIDHYDDMFSSEIRIHEEPQQTAPAANSGRTMTSTQAKYASAGTSDIASEPKGPYGPNKAHDHDQ